MSSLKKIVATRAPSGVVLIRLMVGGIFLSEGIQKYVFQAESGAGRFAGIGFPSPDILARFVGGVEIVCGALLLLGLLTRIAAIPLLATILVAILSTKVPILLGHGFWRFNLGKAAYYGFWGMLHEARADLSMLLGLLFLLLVGAGPISLDRLLMSKRS
jgi:putative oxidoreductase